MIYGCPLCFECSNSYLLDQGKNTFKKNELTAKRQTKCKQCLHFITQGLARTLHTLWECHPSPQAPRSTQRPLLGLGCHLNISIFVIIFKKYFATIFVRMIAMSNSLHYLLWHWKAHWGELCGQIEIDYGSQWKFTHRAFNSLTVILCCNQRDKGTENKTRANCSRKVREIEFGP